MASQQIAAALIRNRWVLLGLAAILLIASIPASLQLKLSWNVESMFPAGHPLVASYQRLQERFGGNQIVLVIYEDVNAWDATGAGLDRLAEASAQIAQVDGVASVLSLAEVDRILRKLAGPAAFLGWDSPGTPALLDKNDKLASAFKQVFEGYTHSSKGNTFAIACVLSLSHVDESQVVDKQGEIVERLREAVRGLPSPCNTALVTGEPVLVADGFRIVTDDGRQLRLASTILVVLVLLACFRSIRWTLIPLAVVQFSIILTEATLCWIGLELTMISSTLAAVLTVIGVATSMHILLLYQSKRRSGLEREVAITQTFADLLPAIVWAIATDAIGFSSLLFAGVGPVQDFGLMMTLGSAAVLLSILLLVPGLSLIGSWSSDPSTPKVDLWLRYRLRRLSKFVRAHRGIGRLILAILFIVSVGGCWMARLETDFTKNFSADSEIVRGYELVEQELGGAGVWDIMLPAPDVISNAYLAKVAGFQEDLRQLTIEDELGVPAVELSKVLSVADADLASRSSVLASALPADARLRAINASMPSFASALICYDAAQDGNWIRIMLRSREQAPAELKQRLIEAVRQRLVAFSQDRELRALIQGTTDVTDNRQAEVAGYHVMLGELVASVLRDQWKCFFVAAAGIMVVVILATGRLQFALIVMVTNALPILMVIGAMGWMGIRVNMGAAMISAVSLGLSVDSSIHYLLHFRRRSREIEPARALNSAQENVGLAAVLATSALVAGFLSMATSEFVPTVVFGTLTSLTMIGGLAGNLLVLPLLFPESLLSKSRS